MRRIAIVLLSLWCLMPSVWAAVSSITEADGSPDCYGWQLKVSNGTLTDNGDATCTVTTGGSSGNSFETIDVPAGTDPVADSATDTLLITETSPLVITGTAATDTIDITWSSVDLGSDGTIQANAVALGTDTTNNYVATVADDGTGTVTVVGSGSETAAVTLKVVDVSCTGCLGTTEIAGLDISDDTNLTAGTAIDITGDAVDFDSTEVEATTWGAGGNASNLWTFNLSGTDPTLTFGSAALTLVGVFTSDGLTLGTDENLTIGSDTLTFAAGTSDFELSDDLTITDTDPHLRLTDSTANQDDFELYADSNAVYLTNVTDGVILSQWDVANNWSVRGTGVTYAWPTADGSNGQFLTTNGSGTLTWTTSSGSGDITDVYNCASGDCNNIVLADGDLLNMSSVSVSSTTEGLILPQHATDCSTAGTAEGQVCWEADGNTLWVGNGATVTQIGSGADTNADKEFWFPAPALLPLEAAESIPPIAKDAGTNTDMMTVDFDQTTDECRTVQLLVPPDITAGGTVTFTVIWYAASVTTNETIWDFRHNSGVADGVDPDVALTTEASSTCTAPGTAGQIDVCTWTETQTNLAWAASDTVVGVLCRDADNVGDDFAADAKVIGFGIRIPRS